MPDIELKVFFVAENGAKGYFDAQFDREVKWDVPLLEGYEFEFLTPGKILDNYSFNAVDAGNTAERLKSFSPDFVWVNGYAHKVVWRALWALRNQSKFIVNSDSNLQDGRTWWRRTIKRLSLKVFYRLMHACISCSPKNHAYLAHYSVPLSKIVQSVMPVDIQFLQAQVNPNVASKAAALKANLGIPSAHRILLFAGKLIPHKRPQDVLGLLTVLQSLGYEDVHVVMVGSGSMSDKLVEMSVKQKLERRVHFVGFVNQSELATYFTMSDLLIFPSEKEPYGVIATETLPFGLPILAADNIGAVGSAILEDRNALLYSCADVEQMGRQADRILADVVLYRRLSQYSKDLARHHDASVLAKDLHRICTESLPIHTQTERDFGHA